MGYIHTVEYYSASRKKEILSYATTWMNFMLNEITQAPKDKYLLIPFICGILSSQTLRNRKQNGGCRVQRGQRKWKLLFNGYKGSVLQDEKGSKANQEETIQQAEGRQGPVWPGPWLPLHQPSWGSHVCFLDQAKHTSTPGPPVTLRPRWNASPRSLQRMSSSS